MAKKKDKAKVANAETNESEFLKDIRKELDLAVDAERHNRREAVDCLNFSMGGTSQWDDLEVQRRKRRRRVMLSLNQCPKYIKQLTGEMRMNRATIKVFPSDSVATKELALIRQGIINDILYQSDYETIQDDGAKQLVTCGYASWRVINKYDEENPFRQEIVVEEVENPLMVFFDPRSKDFFYRDARYCYVLTKIGKDDFADEYPKAKLPGEELRNATTPGGTYEKWYDSNGAITIAERYAVVTSKQTICLMSTGEVLTEADAKKAIKEWEKIYLPAQAAKEMLAEQAPTMPAAGGTPGISAPMPGAMPSPPSAAGSLSMPPVNALAGTQPAPLPPMPSINTPPKPEILDKKDWDVREVRYWKLTGHEILEGGMQGKLVPGKYIPVVLVRGEKLNVEGKTYIKGLINDVRDSQRLLNWWETSAAETIALAPKAPWVATVAQLKGFEKFYAQANEENYPFLAYNVDPETPTTKPSREGMPNAPMAIFAEIDRAEKYVRSAFGMSGADTGDMDQLSGRASGNAIGQRQKPSEATTFVFQDNINKGTMLTGRIIESMIPTIYDTDRDVRTRAIDGTVSTMPINTTLREALERVKKSPGRYPELKPEELSKQIAASGSGETPFNDMSKGKYDTIIKTGPSYATQRAESSDVLIKLTQANPKQMALLSDLIVRNLDILDSDEAADRLEKTLPPGMAKPKPGKPPAQMPPTPQMMIAQAKMQVEQGKLEVQKARIQVEKIKALKQLQGEKTEVRKMLLDLLGEVYAPAEQ